MWPPLAGEQASAPPCASLYLTVISAQAFSGHPVPQYQVIIFAVIAAVVLWQLYNVLGKKVGRQPEEDARARPLGADPAPTPEPQKPSVPVDAATLAAAAGLKARDP